MIDVDWVGFNCHTAKERLFFMKRDQGETWRMSVSAEVLNAARFREVAFIE